MKKQTVFSLVPLSLVIMLASGLAFGQEVKVTPAAPATSINSGGSVGLTQQSPQPSTSSYNWSFVNSEFTFDGKPVKGAPYSAQAISETKQTLSDGNKIVNTSTATLYRDSEGRTRREQRLEAIGGLATGDQPLQTIMINDPVAGLSYTLDPATHTARKGGGSFFFNKPVPGGNASYAVSGGGRVTVNGSDSVNSPKPAPPLVWSTNEITTAPAAHPPRAASQYGKSENVNVEDLGTQSMEGVEATGVRTTFTIPAGQIGNERPIEIVDERWFSKELQVMVMSRHSDPRSGETLYRLINISRTEPDHSLFEVPADYEIKAGAPAPPAVNLMRKPEN